MNGSKITALLAASFMVLSPAAAFAQTADTGTTGTQRQYTRGIRQSNEFQAKVAALPSTAAATIAIPVLFGVSLSNITPNFGDPRDGGARTHEGEDIMAAKGTPIVSPTDAVVLRVTTGVSEGNTVYTANPGGEIYVYMHLDRFGEGVAAGTILAPGSLIGYVGNTGNASGGASHLHFEIHDASNNPIDPYPRLKIELSTEQKISYLNTILGKTSDPVGLAQLLVTNFRSTFTSAAAQGIVLPPLITGALSTVSASASVPTSNPSLPAGDLAIGSSGPDVIALQHFLIAQQNSAATALIAAGATGYFGSITQAALSAYQSAHGLSPANGVYTGATRALIAPQLSAGGQAPAVSVPPPINAIIPENPSSASQGTTLILSRDLSYGATGNDVLSLQQYLNAHGFTIAASGAGSAGAETTYFGAATRAAVIRFQTARAISPAAGFVGPLTRAALAV